MNDTAALPSPMSLFSSAWGLFRAHQRLLVGIVVVPSILTYAGQFLFRIEGPVALTIGVLFSLAGGILSIAMQPAAIIAMHRLSTEPEARRSLTDQYEAGLRFFWPVAYLLLLHLLIMIGSSVMLFVPALIVGGYSVMFLFVRILEDKPGLAAFAESYALVKGRWWKVFGRLLFLGLVYAAVAIVVFLTASGARFLLGFPEDSLGGAATLSLANLAIIAAMGPISAAYSYRLYMSLKSVRALDVPTDSFKRWLKALIALGILVVAALAASLAIFGAAQ